MSGSEPGVLYYLTRFHPPFSATCLTLHPTTMVYQSFEFLVEVFKFKTNAPGSGAGNDEIHRSFARYLVIVLGFIRHDSHSEINIGSDIRRDIMGHNKFEAYRMLNPVSERFQSTAVLVPRSCCVCTLLASVARTGQIPHNPRAPYVSDPVAIAKFRFSHSDDVTLAFESQKLGKPLLLRVWVVGF